MMDITYRLHNIGNKTMRRHFFKNTILIAFFSCLMLSGAQAAKPLWTFLPQTPTDITVVKGGSAQQIIYTVQNQSSRPKILVMKPIAGVTQSTLCHLQANGNCMLTLNINASVLQGDVLGGPVLCPQGNDLECYQPSSANILHIRLIEPPPIQKFTVTPLASANGSITPTTPQIVNKASSLTFTANPNTGFGVNQWLLDGNVVQNGGTTYQLNNIQANHTVEVTFSQTTLSPLTQNLALSINDPGSDPALIGNLRHIRIENTGSVPANNVEVSTSGLPTGTLITSNTCTGTLNAGDVCDIIITPGINASLDAGNNACTTTPGTEPVPTRVTVSADNAPSTDINVLLLGYGCIYQGGFLFSVDDSTPNTGSIGGKVAALTDESGGGFYDWSTIYDDTAADSITDGLSNTNALATPLGQYPAAQSCLNKNDQGFIDWYLPAICELGRYMGSGTDAGCGNTNPNMYSGLQINNLGGFSGGNYWGSSEFSGSPTVAAWSQTFIDGSQSPLAKDSMFIQVRCIRAFIP